MAKKPKKVPKNKRIRLLKDKCWEVMSLFTRLKWANGNGFAKCVTCGKAHHYTKLNAGHFIHGCMDFDERNINPQCVRCNKWLHGNLIQYTTYLMLKHGQLVVEELQRVGKLPHKYTEEELTALLPKLQKKLEQVQNGEWSE